MTDRLPPGESLPGVPPGGIISDNNLPDGEDEQVQQNLGRIARARRKNGKNGNTSGKAGGGDNAS